MRGGNNYGARLRGQLGDVLKGDPGKSAYEIAVEHGYTGTESEWIAYVEANGAQAYQYTQEAAAARDEAVAARSGAIGAKEAAAASAASVGFSAAQAQNAATSAIQSAGNAGVSEASAREYAQAASSYRNAAQAASREAETQALRCVERADEARDAQIRAMESELLVAEKYVEIMGVPETTREYARRAEASATEAGASALSASESAAASSGSAEAAAGSAESAANSLTDINTGLASKLGKTETAVNSEKVNNHTVESDVPAGAVFTDTTYDAMTVQEAEAGTGTTSRVITAKVLAAYVAGALAALVNSAPGTLDTLKEIADALGDDPNFAATMATALAGKLGKTETAVNAEKVNNLTVETAVPSGAVFTDTTYSNATTETAGLMSATDKAKLDGIASGAQVNSVTGVKGNSESSYRTGNVNITKANIGLGNVDNTADANKSVSYADNAGTVNGLTVQTAVPVNAKFTDTTYSAMSASEATTGTATTARTITAKVLADYVAACIATLVNSAPATLDTLNELATALGNDPNFATTMATALGNKLGKTETAVNAEKVNNLTVLTAVPANAKFTDTTYTAASATPLANGTAAVGTSAKYAREDHVHPLQTSVSGSSGSCTGNAATATRATNDENGVRISTNYASQADVDYLATTATNSVSAAVAAQEAAEDARDEAQSIADGLASIRDTAVDTSLAISGQAADSKTVGDKFDVIGASSVTNNEYRWVLLDSQNRVLLGVKADGSVAWQKGVPKPIKDELDAIKARLTALEA